MTAVPIPIEKCMSTVLFLAAPKDTIADASRRMKLHGVRHMPVVDGRRIVGILSEKDILLIESLRNSDPTRVLVEQVMTQDLYTADPLDSLARVAHEMDERRIGSAVVARDGQLLGIFTTTDALRVLAVVMRDSDLVLPTELEQDL